MEREYTGYLARVVQHEMDHLDGVLYTDHMAPDAPLTPTAGPAAVDQALRDLVKEGRRAR